MTDMNLSQLREILQNALIDVEYKSRPERGTVIIDSEGMTVVPFEVGDPCFQIEKCGTEWEFISYISDDYHRYLGCEIYESGLNITTYGHQDAYENLGYFGCPIEDTFHTREEAEAECKRRNRRKSDDRLD